MKTPDSHQPERQIDTEAQDHAQETLYAVNHGGRERHPAQHQEKERPQPNRHQRAETPWQID